MPVQQWEAYGYQLRFEWEQDEVGEAINSIVLPDWVEKKVGPADAVFELKEDERTLSLLHDGKVAAENLTLDSLYQTLKRVCHIDLATYAKDLVFVHSGVVLTEFGLLVIPGRSYTGKSTLVRSLISSGARYFSDEYAVIDGDGLVRPFPRSLCERLQGGKNRYTPADELGWKPDQEPLPIKAVLSTRYQKDESWSPETLSQGEAVLKMLENTVCARTAPQRAISYLAKSVEHSACIQTSRGESDETAALILEWMSGLE